MPTGPGQQNVAGGEHAAALAEQASNHLRTVKADDLDAVVHIFAACPNSLLFFLGKHHRGIAPCIVYELDFDRRAPKKYQPYFVIASGRLVGRTEESRLGKGWFHTVKFRWLSYYYKKKKAK